jgi:hypothetical protein
MRVSPNIIAPALSVVLLAVACAPATTGGSTEAVTSVATSGGSTVRVDQADPSAMTFREATVDDVWKVLPAAFAALRIEGAVMDPAAKVYGNPKVIMSTIARQNVRDMFRCGAEGLSMADYRLEFGIAAQPRKIVSGGTELSVQTTALGRSTSASRSGNTHCVSNGRLELALEKQIRVELDRIGKGR